MQLIDIIPNDDIGPPIGMDMVHYLLKEYLSPPLQMQSPCASHGRWISSPTAPPPPHSYRSGTKNRAPHRRTWSPNHTRTPSPSTLCPRCLYSTAEALSYRTPRSWCPSTTLCPYSLNKRISTVNYVLQYLRSGWHAYPLLIPEFVKPALHVQIPLPVVTVRSTASHGAHQIGVDLDHLFYLLRGYKRPHCRLINTKLLENPPRSTLLLKTRTPKWSSRARSPSTSCL